jgi:hypothetical protein
MVHRPQLDFCLISHLIFGLSSPNYFRFTVPSPDSGTMTIFVGWRSFSALLSFLHDTSSAKRVVERIIFHAHVRQWRQHSSRDYSSGSQLQLFSDESVFSVIPIKLWKGKAVIRGFRWNNGIIEAKNERFLAMSCCVMSLIDQLIGTDWYLPVGILNEEKVGLY